MKNNIPHQPPRLPQRFLQWFCKPALLEDIEGDIEEDFNERCHNSGIRKARLHYWLDVFRFLKPFAIRHFSTQISNIMFKNYFKTSVRSIARNKLFSTINVVGLAISMSVCLLMISFLSELLSYDKFHQNPDRMYRVITSQQFRSGTDQVAATPLLAGKRLQEEVPGIEAIVMMNRRFGGDATVNDKTVNLKGVWASEGFFDVFSGFNLLRGNAQTALASPNSIVLTNEAAIKVFGTDTDPMGQLITLGKDKIFTVTGIIEKPPHNSHFTFEALGSMITYENDKKKNSDNRWIQWTNVSNDYVYLLLSETTDPNQINAHLQQISEEENAKSQRLSVDVRLQSLLSILPGPNLSNNIGKSMETDMIWYLSALSFIIMLSAGFNYTNLSLARSLRRAKEIGVRKVVGASRRQVFSQFIMEAVIVSLIALTVAIALFYVIKPEFLNLDRNLQRAVRLLISPSLFLYFIVFALFTGSMAGFFPAVLLSKLKAVNAFKGGTGKMFRKANMKKVLIVIQFSLSLVFIISAVIAFKQYKYSVNFDLGYQTQNILNVALYDNDHNTVAAAFATIPEVAQIAKSSLIPSLGDRERTLMKYKDPNDSTYLAYNIVDENYIPVMEHQLVAGTNFDSRPGQEQVISVILNEKTLERFKMGKPSEVIDEMIELNGTKVRIQGVVKDFHYQKINASIGPFGFLYIPDSYSYLNLKINSGDLLTTMKKLESTWAQVDKKHEFRAVFFDDQIQAAYAQYSTIFTIASFLAFVAISISSLGLLGMAVYTTESRVKEISIRKVLGASEGKLIVLMARSFIWLLLISAVIALPVAYILSDSVVLPQSTNRVSIGFFELFSGVLLIFSIGFLAIGSQTWKAARANPAQTLRTE